MERPPTAPDGMMNCDSSSAPLPLPGWQRAIVGAERPDGWSPLPRLGEGRERFDAAVMPRGVIEWAIQRKDSIQNAIALDRSMQTRWAILPLHQTSPSPSPDLGGGKMAGSGLKRASSYK